MTATDLILAAPYARVLKGPGELGFGVGLYTAGALPAGFTAMANNTDPTNENYGNYQYTDGSILVFIPKFYYRIGSSVSPRFPNFGLNAIDILFSDTYATEALANAAGYALHRAFKDGGAEKSGFFIDKFLCSKNGVASGKSIKNAAPISLTTDANYNPSNVMTGCSGILADALVLSRARGAGFNCASIFMYDALAKLSLACSQSYSSTNNIAWYGATNNFPKGCNNGALADVNDPTVTFQQSGTAPANVKPNTGSASNLAKTTHNGQSSGVADLNGAIWQAVLGITTAGANATDTAQTTSGDAYVLKSSVSLSSLTSGFGGATDAWGTGANLSANYDYYAGFQPWLGTTDWERFGNGANQVFSGALNGVDYLRSCSGIALPTGMSAAGTPLFGEDGNYRYGRANLFPLASGHWDDGSYSGVFCRAWDRGSRTYDYYYYGFRACAYGS
jgi:hypothetical protein